MRFGKNKAQRNQWKMVGNEKWAYNYDKQGLKQAEKNKCITNRLVFFVMALANPPPLFIK